jgi:hypothetical protein
MNCPTLVATLSPPLVLWKGASRDAPREARRDRLERPHPVVRRVWHEDFRATERVLSALVAALDEEAPR